MQVVSLPMGHEKVHYEAPKPQRIPEEMSEQIKEERLVEIVRYSGFFFPAKNY